MTNAFQIVARLESRHQDTTLDESMDGKETRHKKYKKQKYKKQKQKKQNKKPRIAKRINLRLPQSHLQLTRVSFNQIIDYLASFPSAAIISSLVSIIFATTGIAYPLSGY